VRPLSSIGKAGSTLQRWLFGQDENLTKPANDRSAKNEPLSEERADGQKQRVWEFFEELKAGPQEWLGKVRMINFDSIRDRIGPSWPKLQTKVEILADKIIQDEISGRDRYLNAGDAEFFVFFADATPEESRIRCFAIVEAIHEKLFGLSESANNAGQRVAECYVIHRDNLMLAWEEAGSSVCSQPDYQNPAKILRESFRHDAEILDGADITESAQRVIDSIISSGAESQNISELTPLLVRLKLLTRSLKVLEPALATAGKSLGSRNGEPDTAQVACGLQVADAAVVNASPLGGAWEDIAELTSTLDIGPDRSHADLLAALGRLQRARLERAAKAFADGNSVTARFHLKKRDAVQFRYTPVYRSVSRGERIHQGIYRVESDQEKGVNAEADDGFAGDPRQEQMALERATLEHAIQYLLDRKTSTRFMLMASVHVETLRGPNSQMLYSTILRSAQLRAKRRLLIEVTGYSDTDDTIGIRRAIGELRAHSQAVFISVSLKGLSNLEKVAIECKRSGVHAWGVDVSQFSGQPGAIYGAIAHLSSLGAQHFIPTFVDGISELPILTKAIATGASYVCAPPLRPPLKAPDDAERASLEDLYFAI
jgi:hypothetical protein